jgi:hypothetical protein
MKGVTFQPLRGWVPSAGVNPTIVSYNAGTVKIYNTKSSLVRFESKKTFSSTLKNALAYHKSGVK